MIGITMRDSKSIKWLGGQTGVVDITYRVNMQKWRWPGHLARKTDGNGSYLTGGTGT